MGAPGNAREGLRFGAPWLAMVCALSLPAAAAAQDLSPAPALPPLAIRIDASADTINLGDRVVLTIRTGYEIGGAFHADKSTSVSVNPSGTTTYSYVVTDSAGAADAASVTIHVLGSDIDAPVAVRSPAQVFGSIDGNDGAIRPLGSLDPEDGLEEELPVGEARSLSLEAGPALVGMGPGAASFGVIGGSLAVVRDSVFYVTLLGGVRWMGPSGDDPLFPTSPRPAFQDRRQTLVSLGVSYYRWGAVGISVAGVAAWEIVRASDHYLKRAYGAAGGVRYRRPLLGVGLVLGVDVLYMDLSEFQRVDSRWRLGISPSVSLNLFP